MWNLQIWCIFHTCSPSQFRLQAGPIANVQYPHGASVHHIGEHSLRTSLLFTSGHCAVGLGPYLCQRSGKLWSIQWGREGGDLLRQVVLDAPHRLVIRTGHIENILQAITTRCAFHMPCHLILSKTLGDKCYLETRIREVKWRVGHHKASEQCSHLKLRFSSSKSIAPKGGWYYLLW